MKEENKGKKNPTESLRLEDVLKRVSAGLCHHRYGSKGRSN